MANRCLERKKTKASNNNKNSNRKSNQIFCSTHFRVYNFCFIQAVKLDYIHIYISLRTKTIRYIFKLFIYKSSIDIKLVILYIRQNEYHYCYILFLISYLIANINSVVNYCYVIVIYISRH